MGHGSLLPSLAGRVCVTAVGTWERTNEQQQSAEEHPSSKAEISTERSAISLFLHFSAFCSLNSTRRATRPPRAACYPVLSVKGTKSQLEGVPKFGEFQYVSLIIAVAKILRRLGTWQCSRFLVWGIDWPVDLWVFPVDLKSLTFSLSGYFPLLPSLAPWVRSSSCLQRAVSLQYGVPCPSVDDMEKVCWF